MRSKTAIFLEVRRQIGTGAPSHGVANLRNRAVTVVTASVESDLALTSRTSPTTTTALSMMYAENKLNQTFTYIIQYPNIYHSFTPSVGFRGRRTFGSGADVATDGQLDFFFASRHRKTNCRQRHRVRWSKKSKRKTKQQKILVTNWCKSTAWWAE